MAIAFRGQVDGGFNDTASMTCGFPTGVQVGDFLIFEVVVLGSDRTAMAAPAGWTKGPAVLEPGTVTTAVWFTAKYTAGMSAPAVANPSSDNWVTAMWGYSGVDSLRTSVGQANLSSTSAPSGSINAVAGDKLLWIGTEVYGGQTIVPPAGFTNRGFITAGSAGDKDAITTGSTSATGSSSTSDPTLVFFGSLIPGGTAPAASGSVSATGGGLLVVSGAKTAKAGLAISGGGSVTAAGDRLQSDALIVSGGGSLTASASKSASSSVSVSGGGTLGIHTYEYIPPAPGTAWRIKSGAPFNDILVVGRVGEVLSLSRRMDAGGYFRLDYYEIEALKVAGAFDWLLPSGTADDGIVLSIFSAAGTFTDSMTFG